MKNHTYLLPISNNTIAKVLLEMHRLRLHDFAKATDDEAGTNLGADARLKVKKGQL